MLQEEFAVTAGDIVRPTRACVFNIQSAPCTHQDGKNGRGGGCGGGRGQTNSDEAPRHALIGVDGTETLPSCRTV
jgi:hypothetical protein